ncbi:hypothetical protein H8356DRAFT_230225 [Neocallimastix lanati (nom. inval.)]|nr:hypothetical protein H8356DRAFT_230225 [Neocallimastix sp. JGI-2020a]
MSSAKVQSSKESSAYPETLEKDNNSSLRRESLSEICIPKVPIIGDFANEDHDLSRTNTFFSPTGIMTSSPSSMSPVLSPRESVREGNANYVLTGNTSPIGNFTIQDSYSPVSPASGYPTQDFNGYPIQDHQVFPSHDIGFSSHDYNGFPLRVNNEFSPQDNNKGLGIDFLNDSSRQILFNPPPINDLSRQSSVYPPSNNDLSRQGPIYPPPNNNLSRQGSAYPSGNNDLSMPPQNNNLSRQGSAYPSGNNDLSRQGSAYSPQNNNLSRQGSAYPSGNNDLSRQGSAYSPQNNNPTPQNENTANIDSGFGVCRSLCSNTRTLTDDEVKKACKEFYDIISTFNPKEDSVKNKYFYNI